MTVGLSTDFINTLNGKTPTPAKDVAIDTRKFSGYNLQEYKAAVEEGLKGSDKEFYERLQKRGIESSFLAFDTDGDGVLSKDEAIGVSSTGLSQKKFAEALNGGSGAFLARLMAQITAQNTNSAYDSILNSLNSLGGTSTGMAAPLISGGSTAASAINFAMQFNGKSASEMSGLMSKTGFHAGLWCADFVYFAMKNAYDAAGKSLPEGYETINHAYCPSIASWARSTGRAYSDPSQAKPGDLVIINSEGHIGIVVKVDSEGIHTIEGNTSNASGHYGSGYVCTKVRKPSCVSTFVRMD